MTTTSHLTDEQHELLERLQSVRGLANESQWTVFENTLEQLRGTDSPEVLAALFQLFREHDPHDAMERLLHVVEASSRNLYVPALVTATPRLMREARFWAGVLHMRVLQSPDDLHAYAAEFVRLPQLHRAACEAAFADAVMRRPDLRPQADEFHAMVDAAERR